MIIKVLFLIHTLFALLLKTIIMSDQREIACSCSVPFLAGLVMFHEFAKGVTLMNCALLGGNPKPIDASLHRSHAHPLQRPADFGRKCLC